MSEATEVPMVCDDCGGTLTDNDAYWLRGGGAVFHITFSQCFTSLDERLTTATQRAEAAEAAREKWYDRAVKEHVRRVSAEAASASADAAADGLRTERDALRKDAEMLREAIDIFISFQGSTREPEGQAALDAALAVQPTTGETHE